jgi:ABC-type sugar transport system substrate-binding protein
MKRMICGMLSATLMLASVPAGAAAAENTTFLTESAVQNHFRQAIDHAVAAVASQPVDASEVVQPAQAPTAAQASQTVSRSGGHVVALVTTLVTSAVGMVGMVYYMKMMKKQTTGQAK